MNKKRSAPKSVAKKNLPFPFSGKTNRFIYKALFYGNCVPLLALAIFALLAFITVTGYAAGFNLLVYNMIAATIQPGLTAFLRGISILGEWFTYTPLILVLLILPQTRYPFGLPIGITMALSASGNQVLKRIFQIPRPEIHRLYEASGYSFPSGHSMAAMAFACICFYLLQRQGDPISDRRSVKAVLPLIVLLLFPLLMGFSRIYLGVHTISDVLAAYCMGYLVSFMAAKISRQYISKISK